MNIQEQNKEIFRKVMQDFFVKHDLSAVDRYYAPSYIQHNEKVAEWAKSQGLTALEGVKQFFAGFFKAFPDFAPTIEHLYAEEDKVFAFVSWRGTHLEAFLGIPATNQSILIRTAEIMRIENGFLMEHWDVVDDSVLKEALKM
jgi:steroid delta-isomerase-like uncharacterized protein